MSECPHDLRDYVLDELSEPERRAVEAYLAASPQATAEVERLRMTHRALTAVAEEQPPRRIAFVSDPVFEPSAGLRWWRAFWTAAPRFALGGAALLAVVFGGIWVTEPVVARSADGWELAFGGARPVAAQPVVAEPGLSADDVRGLVAEVIAQSEERSAARISEALDRQRKELNSAQERRIATLAEDSTAAMQLIGLELQDLRLRVDSRQLVAVNGGGGR